MCVSYNCELHASLEVLKRAPCNQTIDWLIIGCESGGKRRFQVEYENAARSLIKQGIDAGVAVFHKQMPHHGKVSTDPFNWDADLRLQQWPAVQN